MKPRRAAAVISPPLPLPNTYWVIPGQLLAGEYPGAQQSRTANTRLQKFLAAGINTFVDLTAVGELAPYDELLPSSAQHIRRSITDHGIPVADGHMVETLMHVQRALKAGRRVYVHCRAGIGRTGTVVGCLLIERGLRGDDALYELNRLWQQCARSESWPAIPETDDQVEYVRRWTARLPVGDDAAPLSVDEVIAPETPPKREGLLARIGLTRRSKPPRAEPLLDAAAAAGAASLDPPPKGSIPKPADGGRLPPKGRAPADGGRSSQQGRTPTDAGRLPPTARAPTAQPDGGRTASQGRATPSVEPATRARGRIRADAVPPSAQSRPSAAPIHFAPPSLNARFAGAMVGLAIGDALAVSTQDQSPGSFHPLTTIIGGGMLNLPAGAWSDDTALALCLTESLLEQGDFDAKDQVERYTWWQQDGYLSATGECIGITPGTSRALAMAQWRRQVFAGSHDPRQLDPRPLARIAPVVLFSHGSIEQAIEWAEDSARTICQAPKTLEVCRLFATMLHAALHGASKQEVLSPAWSVPDDRPKSRLRGLIEGRYRTKDPTALRATENTLDVLEVALWAFERSSNFADGALLAANVGENSDVAASVYGQLAGIYYGVEGIPNEWRNLLIKKDLIESLALRLLTRSAAAPQS